MLGGVALCVAGFLVWNSSQEDGLPAYESLLVERGTIAHVVSVTGHLEPTVRLELAFPVGGIIENISTQEGVYLGAGSQIATLRATEEQAAVREAEARLAREQALYEELAAPLRGVAVAVEDAKVTQTSQAARAAEDSAVVALARAFVYADDALHEEVDELFDEGGGSRFGIAYQSGNTTYYIQDDYTTSRQLNERREAAERALISLEARAEEGDIAQALVNADTDLRTIEAFITLLARTVNDYVGDTVAKQTVYDAFQTTVASARTSLATARSEVAGARSTLVQAAAARARSEEERTLAAAGASSESLRTQQAAVTLARRAVELATARAAHKVLFVPVSGRISRIEKEVGETVQAYVPVVELIADDDVYEVEAYIPEADIAEVALGDQAAITFDAFRRDQVFSGEVMRIALTETLREGVPTYKTTLVVTSVPDTALVLRPGMTADIDITTDSRADVLSVPTRSVLSKDGSSYVRVVVGGAFVERSVETGLRSSMGTVEVLQGLREGEEVVLYIEDE